MENYRGTPDTMAAMVILALQSVIDRHGLDLGVVETDWINQSPVDHVAFRMHMEAGDKWRVIMMRPKHPLDALGTEMIDMALAAGEGMRRSIDAAVARLMDSHVRLVWRDRQMVEAGYDRPHEQHGSDAPSWAYTIDPILNARRLSEGLTEADILVAARMDQQADLTGSARSPYHITMRGADMFSRSIDLTGGAHRVTYERIGDVPVIRIMECIPASLVNGIVGHPLDEVVAHPWLAGSGAVITRVKTAKTRRLTTLWIDMANVLLGSPPEGVGGSWHLRHLP